MRLCGKENSRALNRAERKIKKRIKTAKNSAEIYEHIKLRNFGDVFRYGQATLLAIKAEIEQSISKLLKKN